METTVLLYRFIPTKDDNDKLLPAEWSRGVDTVITLVITIILYRGSYILLVGNRGSPVSPGEKALQIATNRYMLLQQGV